MEPKQLFVWLVRGPGRPVGKWKAEGGGQYSAVEAAGGEEAVDGEGLGVGVGGVKL